MKISLAESLVVFRRAAAALLCLFLIGIGFGSAARAEESAPVLRLGIVPFASLRNILSTHGGLRDYLAEELKRPVTIYFSPDHGAFLLDSLAGKFDVVIIPGHLGIICMDAGFTPIARYAGSLSAIFVLRTDSPIKQLADLRGKKIAFPDQFSLYSIAMPKLLRDVGLLPDLDYTFIERPNHSAAIMSAVTRETDAAATAYEPLAQMSVEVREKLKAIEGQIDFPHLFILASPSLGAEMIRKTRAAFERFPQTAQGRKFMLRTGYTGYVPVSAEDVRRLKPFAEITRSMLGMPPPKEK